LREIISEAQNQNLFPELKILRSTALSWVRNDAVDVVSLPQLRSSDEKLIIENQSLRQKVEQLSAEKELAVTTFRLFGLQIQYKRLPKGDAKSLLLEAITKAQKTLALEECLKAIQLSKPRFHAWTKKKLICKLADKRSYPKSTPTRLTFDEISKVKGWLMDKSKFHYSIFAVS
jgi:hypothetical protein